jgi:3-oxoacyl-[acyl-carrier protein] reductase
MLSGDSRGLGVAIVEALVGAGYRVSTFSRRPTELVESLSGHERFWFATADMADPGSLAAFVSAAIERFGHISGLVNFAGFAVDGVLAMMPEERIDTVVGVNLIGALKLTQLVVRSMLSSSEPASIVNISSIIGLRGYSGLSAYAASKGGLDAMTRTLARELGGRRIRVNSVVPGYLETEMTHGLSTDQKQQIVRRTPLGRLGQPRDVVGAVLLLLSDASEFMTGQTLVIDGGITT